MLTKEHERRNREADAAPAWQEVVAMPSGPGVQMPAGSITVTPIRSSSWRPVGPPQPPPAVRHAAAGRNDPCPCQSGRKYKRCCGT